MGDDLVAVKVEIDPFVTRSPFAAAHGITIKLPRRGEIVDGKGEVERAQCHGDGIGERFTFSYSHLRVTA